MEEKPSEAFRCLMKEFFAAAGTPEMDLGDSPGVEFETDQFVSSLYPHPTREELLVIDIAVRVIEGEPSAPAFEQLLRLHQFNAISRFTTEWLTVVEENVLLVTRFEPIAQHTGITLSELVADGLERAEALVSGWESIEAIQRSSRDHTKEPLSLDRILERASFPSSLSDLERAGERIAV